LGDVYDLLKSSDNMALDAISDKIRSTMSVDACSIYILASNLDELSLISTAGLPDSTVGQRIKVGEGIVGYVAQTRTTLAIEDATLDPRALRIATGPSAKRRTYHSVLSVPLVTEDKLVGVIDARTFRAKSWEQREIDFFALVAKYVADAIGVSRL
jgi:phosphotransferase system enzyme I (PtsP)